MSGFARWKYSVLGTELTLYKTETILLYLLCFSGCVCLSVCIFINVETAEPIRPKFCVRPYMTQGLWYIKIGEKKSQDIVGIFFENVPIRKETPAKL